MRLVEYGSSLIREGGKEDTGNSNNLPLGDREHFHVGSVNTVLMERESTDVSCMSDIEYIGKIIRDMPMLKGSQGHGVMAVVTMRTPPLSSWSCDWLAA